jgi:hypothetical protein
VPGAAPAPACTSVYSTSPLGARLLFSEMSNAADRKVNRLDGADRPAVVSNIVINARGTATLNCGFCFVGPNQHTVQSTFTGIDANGYALTVTTPIVTLTAKP